MTLMSFPQGSPGPIGSLGHPGPRGVVVSKRGLWGQGVTLLGHPAVQAPHLYPTGSSRTERLKGVPGK